ncbi:glycoside hydrolase family 3 N-terminal domain-containing protein [Microbacterium sp. LWO13-1.2]|uniref:glycoside hydrolase family 3 N-terminal domain-containing protein n=1 Tax=Microbacterium sp. LWO13-1.2 TaxID=3135262 RepID=UPI003138B408
MRRNLTVRVAGALMVAVAALTPAAASADLERAGVVDTARKSGPADRAETIVSAMSVQEQAASVVMGHIPSTDAATLSTFMSAENLGGFILMGSNVPGSEAELLGVTAALTIDPELPPLIAIDQEGGDVSRIGWDDFPAAPTLKDSTPAATSAAFAARASLVARGGANVNFGIVADTTADGSSFIFSRSLGADPQSAADRVAAAVTAEEQFLASTLKHFPGHGAAPGDSHQQIPSTAMTIEQWRAADALPFIAGIDAGASLLMFGHLAYTAVDPAPASLSARWHEIAREELGFDGVIITDDLGMLQSTGIPAYADPVANAVAALAAGTDLVLTIAHSTPETAAQLTAGIVAAVEAGALPVERLQEAAERVLTLRLELAGAGSGWALCAECAPVS